MRSDSLKKLALLIPILVASFVNIVKADFVTIAGWEEQVFPSYLIATAAMKKT